MDQNETTNPQQPLVFQRGEHHVSRTDISEHALKVLYRLHKAGYDAYLVGGCVRDTLLGLHPKDFDVVTNAHPEDVSALFRNSRLIGRRFRLVHVLFGRELIEVATFRGHSSDGITSNSGDIQLHDGMILRDNVYGTLEEDAWRRDFTINALYYNIADFSVVDYTGGYEDLKARTIRIIGDPVKRYREDPVRMLRAIRFAAKLDFELSPETDAPIHELADRLTAVPPARLFEEMLKLFLNGNARRTYELLRKYNLFEYLFPSAHELLMCEDVNAVMFNEFIKLGLSNTDNRIAMGKPVTPAFLFAIFLWGPMMSIVRRHIEFGMRQLQAFQLASAEVIAHQAEHIALPKRFSLQTREIWAMQPRLQNRAGKRPLRLLALPRFRAGYDFMLLRCEAGETELESLCEWWTSFQELPENQRSTMILPKTRSSRNRKRSRRR